MDADHQMCFQRTSDLPKAPTEHVYHLRLECMGHEEQEGFQGLIAVEIESRPQELLHDDFKWMKDEIMDDADKARNNLQLTTLSFDIIRLGEIVRSNFIIW